MCPPVVMATAFCVREAGTVLAVSLEVGFAVVVTHVFLAVFIDIRQRPLPGVAVTMMT